MKQMVVIMGMSVLLGNDTWHEFLGLCSDQERHPRMCIGGQ